MTSSEYTPYTATKGNIYTQHTTLTSKMGLPKWLLPASLALLMIDAIIEQSFVSSMVAWLHRFAGGEFTIVNPDRTSLPFTLHGKPEFMLVNQGHTTNAAAGTAFVYIGLGGILALWLRSRAEKRGRLGGFSLFLYHFWLVGTVLSVLLTISALVYTFLVTHQHAGQTIDLSVAAGLHNKPYPNMVPYPLQKWTPENWYTAVLKLDLAEESDRDNINSHLTIMKAWRWNLIPLLVLGSWFSAIAVVDAVQRRRARRSAPASYKVDA